VKQLTGKDITDGALAQRRALLPPAVFEQLMSAALKPKAVPEQHPDAFYHGLRLCGVDGSLFSVTAIQEIAALILAYAVLVDYRVDAAGVGQVGVLRIRFLKTLRVLQGLWQFLQLSGDLLSPAQVRLVVRRALRQIAEMAIPKRPARSCPRALRQPVSNWPRLRKNTYRTGSPECSVGEIYV
jgi:hypothetical protein